MRISPRASERQRERESYSNQNSSSHHSMANLFKLYLETFASHLLGVSLRVFLDLHGLFCLNTTLSSSLRFLNQTRTANALRCGHKQFAQDRQRSSRVSYTSILPWLVCGLKEVRLGIDPIIENEANEPKIFGQGSLYSGDFWDFNVHLARDNEKREKKSFYENMPFSNCVFFPFLSRTPFIYMLIG